MSVRAFVRFVRVHFEALAYASFALDAAVLAVVAGRARIALVGLGSVLPFAVAYVVRVRGGSQGRR